jgi:hypothetical protein
VPALALHGINGESAGNYHLIDEESTGGRGFCRELPAHRREFTRGRGFYRERPAYLLGFRLVRSKLAENPSNGNNSRISSSKYYILTIPFLNLNTKTSLKLKINLVRLYLELNVCPMK